MFTVISLVLFAIAVLKGWAVGMNMQEYGSDEHVGAQLCGILIEIFLLVCAVYLWTIRNSVSVIG